jgi:hypothetical protein
LFTVGRYGALPKDGGDRELSNHPWSSGLPMLLGLWLENAGCSPPSVFNF